MTILFVMVVVLVVVLEMTQIVIHTRNFLVVVVVVTAQCTATLQVVLHDLILLAVAVVVLVLCMMKVHVQCKHIGLAVLAQAHVLVLAMNMIVPIILPLIIVRAIILHTHAQEIIIQEIVVELVEVVPELPVVPIFQKQIVQVKLVVLLQLA